MRIPVVASLRRGRAIAVLAVLIVAACTTYGIKTAAPLYSDGATVIFYAAPKLADSAGETSFDQSLIVTEAMLAQTMMSHVPGSAGMIQIQALACNHSDLEYPDYAEQCATLTATSPGVAAVHQAFWLAYRTLRSRLMKLQASSGVVPRNRIGTYLVGMSGPVPQRGSRTRVLAGLALLTLIATVTVWRLFALRPGWARSRRHRRGGRRHTRRSAGRTAD